MEFRLLDTKLRDLKERVEKLETAMSRGLMLLVATTGYGFLAAAFWIGVEVRVAAAKRAVAERRGRLEARLSAMTRPATAPEAPREQESEAADETKREPTA